MEDNHERKKGEPLLYIQQPLFKKPDKIKMQDSFYSEGTDITIEQENNQQNEEQTKQQVPALENTLPTNHKEESLENEEHTSTTNEDKKPISAADYFRKNPTQTRKNWNLSPVKSFRNMSIPEKLQYLSSFPSNQQPYPCEFITESERHRGTLSKYEQGKITVSTMTGEIAEVNPNDLQAIRIIF